MCNYLQIAVQLSELITSETSQTTPVDREAFFLCTWSPRGERNLEKEKPGYGSKPAARDRKAQQCCFSA
jgi:hypothetical protein